MRRRSVVISAALAAAMAQPAVAQEATLTGRVAECFGRRFVIETDAARILVVPAPRAALSPEIGEVVTVTGREDGDTLRGADRLDGPEEGDRPAPRDAAPADDEADRGSGARGEAGPRGGSDAEDGPAARRGAAEGDGAPEEDGSTRGDGPRERPEAGRAGEADRPAPTGPEGRTGGAPPAPPLSGGPPAGAGAGSLLARSPRPDMGPSLTRGDGGPRGPAAFAPPGTGAGTRAGTGARARGAAVH